MKNTIRTLGGAAAVLAAVTLQPLAFGQASVTQTTTSDGRAAVTQTTTSDGTISEFSPDSDSVVIHSEGSASPLRYSYSKSTTIVDESGNPVDVSVVKSGVPVQVYYDRDGDRMIARRIIVHRRIHEEAPAVTEHRDTTTTTTTTEGRDHDHDH